MGKHPKPEEKRLARELRRCDGMPLKKIARIVGVSVASVSVWTRDIELTPEQKRRNLWRAGQAHQILIAGRVRRARDRRRAWQAEGRRRARAGDSLHQAGCMLYWAEGAKDRNALCFANSDVEMVRFFCRFLRESLSVPTADFTLRLNVYTGNGLGLEDIENRWLTALELPRSCLRGHTLNHNPTSSSGNKKGRLPYGVCQIRVLRSTRLVQHIYGAIQEYGGFEEARWLDGRPRKSQAGKSRRRLGESSKQQF